MGERRRQVLRQVHDGEPLVVDISRRDVLRQLVLAQHGVQEEFDALFSGSSNHVRSFMCERLLIEYPVHEGFHPRVTRSFAARLKEAA